MVLTMANGGVYFFQAGTEELVNEWVSTCNYCAARTSKEPLTGGVSNMEYGWNRVLDPDNNSDAVSVRSCRSQRSKYSKKDFAASVRGEKSPYSDRTFINDWKPPMPPSVASVHDEEGQMDALQKHASALKEDLTQHNELRQPMTALVRCIHSDVLHILTLTLVSMLPARQTPRKPWPTGRSGPSGS